MIYDLAKGALFALDAEHAHELTIAAFARFPRLATAPFAGQVPDDPAEVLGLRFRNRVGLSAGLDKNGECIEAFDRLGFGFIEVGTVTPRPQPGNPKPRLFRVPQAQALINRLGFNNHGVDALVERARRAPRQAVLGINIGKNKDTPVDHAADDYDHCLRKVHAVADYVTVNISSPNTQGLRELQDQQRLAALLERLRKTRAELAQREGKRVPLLVKIAPDLEPSAIAELAKTVREHGVDGLIATNTTIERPGLEGVTAAREPGGLSGAPLRPLAFGVLKTLRAAVGADFPLIGVGGIMSGEDARARRAAGAHLVQIYTGFIYSGPPLVADCVRAMRLPAGARVR